MAKVSRREFLVAGGIAAVAGPIIPSMARSTSSATSMINIDPLSLVDPEFRGALEPLLKGAGDFALSTKTLQEARKSFPPSVPAPTPPCEERLIPGYKGAPDVHVIVVNSNSNDRKPCIIHMHGGGFVMGSAAGAIPRLQQIASDHACVILTVDYRLAPETRFPGSLEDNYAALKWLYSSADSLGVDRSRVAVMGESAGGGHAAMLAIAARDRGEVPVSFQLLIYPMLDDRTGSSRQVPLHLGAYVWLPADNRFGWSSLLGVPAGSLKVPAGAVPGRVENLCGLPPAFIGVGSVDLFVDEDIEYARRLISSGVPTELCVVPGAYHGFDGIAPEAIGSKAFRNTWNAALAKAFATNTSFSGAVENRDWEARARMY